MPTTPLLTDEQRQALQDSNDRGPVTVLDPQTQVNYILLRANLYDRCRLLLTDEELGSPGVVRQVGVAAPGRIAADVADQ